MTHTIRFAAVSLLSISVLIYSCQKDMEGHATANVDKPHLITVYLTDDQAPVFDSVFIDIQRLEVKVEDDSLGNEGWVTLNINPGVYNILRFRNGIDTLFATGTLPNARVKKIRLTLGMQNSVMKNGQRFPLNVRENDREVVVNIESGNFEIVAPGQVLFWIDFDAGRSIQVDNSGSGNDNGYRLRPQLRIFTKAKSGRIEGKVLPSAADPVVMAIRGADTSVAIPDGSDGEFKILGLREGIYKVLMDGRNNYNDTTINNVIVRKGEDTHLPAVKLHQ